MRGRTVKHTVVTRIDPATGNPVRQLTSLPGNHHHLYFTSSSFGRSGDHIILLSDAGGSPNLYRLSVADGTAVQLTDNRKGIMQSYVYYDGEPYAGLAKASPSYHAPSGRLLFIQDQEVRLIDVETGAEDVLYTLPENVMTGFTHLSADGRYACVPYIASEAFRVGAGNPFGQIRRKVHDERIESHVLVIDTATKRGEIRFSQVGWITHVQFHPEDPNKILFNHEGGMVDQRIWLFDHGVIRPIREQAGASGSSPLWICHEMWTARGDGVIYHGTTGVPNDPAMADIGKNEEEIVSFVGLYDMAGDRPYEIPFPPEMKAYGHFTASSDDRRLLTDGVIEANGIHILEPNWAEGTVSWVKACDHNSSFSVQDVHPHPIFSPDDRAILFASDAHNERAQGHVYLVELKSEQA